MAFLKDHDKIHDKSTSTVYLKYKKKRDDLWKEIYDFFDEYDALNKYRKDDIINLILVRNGEILWAARWGKDRLRKLTKLTGFLRNVSRISPSL